MAQVNILDMIKQSARSASASQDLQETLTTEALNVNQDIVQASNQAADLATDLAIDANTKQAKVQAQTELLRGAINGDIDTPNNLILQQAAAFNAASAKSLALQDTILKKQSVEFLDDPLAWFAARYSIDGDIEQYNQTTAMASNAQNKIKEIESTISTSAQARAATTQTLSQDMLLKN